MSYIHIPVTKMTKTYKIRVRVRGRGGLLCRLFGHKYHNDKLLMALSGRNACIRCDNKVISRLRSAI